MPEGPSFGTPDADPLMTLIYTSGSTGTPKGAMFPESLWIKHWQTGFSGFFSRSMLELPFVTVNYMPLNHGAGIMQLQHDRARRDHVLRFEERHVDAVRGHSSGEADVAPPRAAHRHDDPPAIPRRARSPEREGRRPTKKSGGRSSAISWPRCANPSWETGCSTR